MMNFQDFSLREIKVLYYIFRHNNCKIEKILKKFSRSVLATLKRPQDNRLIIISETIGITVRGGEVAQDYKQHLRDVTSGRVCDAVLPLLGVVVGYLLSLIK